MEDISKFLSVEVDGLNYDSSYKEYNASECNCDFDSNELDDSEVNYGNGKGTREYDDSGYGYGNGDGYDYDDGSGDGSGNGSGYGFLSKDADSYIFNMDVKAIGIDTFNGDEKCICIMVE